MKNFYIKNGKIFHFWPKKVKVKFSSVLRTFLTFGHFELQRSYSVRSYKKKSVLHMLVICLFLTVYAYFELQNLKFADCQ